MDTHDYISAYSRADAIADGTLKDVTEWASSSTGFIGGFRFPVAVTRVVWLMIQDIPEKHRLQDIRGRAHDVLFMSSLAVRRHRHASRVEFQVYLPTQAGDEHSFVMEIHGGDCGEPVMTIRSKNEACNGE